MVNRTTYFTVLAYFLAIPFLLLSDPLSVPAPQYNGNNSAQGISNFFTGMSDAAARAAMIQQFSQQTLKPEDIATVQLYKPVIAYLNSDKISEEQRNRIVGQAFADGGVTLPLFCSKAFNIICKEKTLPLELQQEMTASLRDQAAKVTDSSFTALAKNALTLGLALGLVNCMEKVIGDSLSRVVSYVPNVFAFIGSMTSRGYNVLCGRPNGFDTQEILLWEQTLEHLIATLCEHNVSGTLMLKNMRINDDSDAKNNEQQDQAWSYFVIMTKDLCGHVVAYFDERLPYYAGGHHQRRYLVSLANAVSDTNIKSIVFTVELIKRNLQHLTLICEKTTMSEDLDRTHVKKIGRITLLLFNKLRTMLGSSSQNQGYQGGMPMQHNGLLER